MGVYYMNEAAFAPDTEPVDLTVTELRFDLGHEGGAPPAGGSYSLSVHRRPLADGETLAASVAANAREADRSLPAHTVLFQRELEVAGVPAIDIGASWRGKESMLYTRQAHLLLGGTVLILAGNAPLDARSKCDEMLDRVLATFRPRG
jgi:hypothetical protein